MDKTYKNKYQSSTIRLQNWDYSQDGFYFITICTKERENYFGEINNYIIDLNEIGHIVKKYWLEIPNHFKNVDLDEFVIMPNHIHGIIIIEKSNITSHVIKNRFKNQGKHTISSIIGAYKSICTKTINKTHNKIFFGWQSRFYDHIIRDENDLSRIRDYIKNNLVKWNEDKNNPKNL